MTTSCHVPISKGNLVNFWKPALQLVAYWVSVALARGTKGPYIPEGQVQIDINFLDAI